MLMSVKSDYFQLMKNTMNVEQGSLISATIIKYLTFDTLRTIIKR